jgi:neutral ceramidase
MTLIVSFVLVVVVSFAAARFSGGTGIADITPSVAEVGFMGYGNPGQVGAGLHYRLHARAFVVRDAANASAPPFAYVNIGAAMIFHETKVRALQLLQAALGGQRVFDFANTLICATHTHSGPGGFTYFPLYDITTLGFQRHSLEVVAQGIADAVLMALQRMRPNVDLLVNVAELVQPQTNINRSPSAYLANPASERARYAHDVDKNFTTLRLDDASTQEPLGVINWFAVHGTSMNNTNVLVSGDNKGHAMYLTEKWINGNLTLSGRGPFVAAFSQTNEGDVSPNTRGASLRTRRAAAPTRAAAASARASTCSSRRASSASSSSSSAAGCSRAPSAASPARCASCTSLSTFRAKRCRRSGPAPARPASRARARSATDSPPAPPMGRACSTSSRAPTAAARTRSGTG